MSAIPASATSKPVLFLLEPAFEDPAQRGQRFFCRHNLLLEGVLSGVAELQDQLDIRHVAFPRPRLEVIDLIGESDQSLPKLVLPAGVSSAHANGEHAGRQYVSGAENILNVLTELYDTPRLHS